MLEKRNLETGKETRRYFIERFAVGTVGLNFLCKSVTFGEEEPSKEKKNDTTPKFRRKEGPEFQEVEDVLGLPRVLLIGDSISVDYTLPTRELLKGKANVHRAPENCKNTAYGLERIDWWLGDTKWDVIHFNWGLHDLKYEPDKSPDRDDLPFIPLEQYQKNMEALVLRLKKTGARLIFATTTPYPEGVNYRYPEDVIKYNEAALAIMKKYDIMVDDLYTFALPRLKDLQRPVNVHFLPEGSKALSEQTAKSILDALEKKADSPLKKRSDILQNTSRKEHVDGD